MSEPAASLAPGPVAGADNPFSPRAALGLILFGGLVFVALLYMIGAGMTGGSTNDGGAHAGGKGLNGYAALAGFLERRGYTVRRAQNAGALDAAGLLVLTPPPEADGAALEKIVGARRNVGPTLLILPKWIAVPAPAGAPGAKTGWVQLGGTASPRWRGFLDNVTATIAPVGGGKTAGWLGAGIAGKLPDARSVQSGTGETIVPLVRAREDGRVLAGYVADNGSYPALEAMAGAAGGAGEDEGAYPLVVVFEPDLLDNYGMADAASARLAGALVRAAGANVGGPVNFDLTLNGHVRSQNLLTLAFTPPFLAATLCLLIAALAAGWRGFLRFGPPRRTDRAIAFGKRALVANSAGLIRRTRRLHLVSAPYAAGARERLVRQLALPRLADAAATDAAIDRALAAREPDATPFSAVAARLAAARRPHDLLKAAQDLHALERMLQR